MRKMIIIGAALIFAITVMGCGNNSSSDTTISSEEQETSSAPQTYDTTAESPADNTSDVQSETTESETTEENDILIIYFSAANMNDLDAVTSATPLIDGESSVAWMADVIQETVGGEIVKIIPAEDYPLSYNDVADAAKEEADEEIHPAIAQLGVDPSSYKTVFIGYPIWWYRMPMVLETFFDTYDFTGVTIIPFNTHEGSRDGGTVDMIRDREPDANVLEGLAIRGNQTGTDSSREEIIEWLNGPNLK